LRLSLLRTEFVEQARISNFDLPWFIRINSGECLREFFRLSVYVAIPPLAQRVVTTLRLLIRD